MIIGQTSTTAYRSLDVGSLLLNVVARFWSCLGWFLHFRPVEPSSPGRTRARHAVPYDALPFLRQQKTSPCRGLRMGCRSESLAAPQGCRSFPAHHHITNVTERVLPDEPIAGDVLLRFAKTERRSHCFGAYGHSRLGEWIFGGVTRDLLTKSPVCCLFSH